MRSSRLTHVVPWVSYEVGYSEITQFYNFSETLQFLISKVKIVLAQLLGCPGFFVMIECDDNEVKPFSKVMIVLINREQDFPFLHAVENSINGSVVNERKVSRPTLHTRTQPHSQNDENPGHVSV